MGVILAKRFPVRIVFCAHIKKRIGVLAIKLALHRAFFDVGCQHFTDEQIHFIVERDLLRNAVFDTSGKRIDDESKKEPRPPEVQQGKPDVKPHS